MSLLFLWCILVYHVVILMINLCIFWPMYVSAIFLTYSVSDKGL